jgi:hypothetical protein
MSWTAPRTWTTSEVVTAAIMNTHVRDNLLETAASKASAAAQTVFSTAANALAMVTGSKYKTADENVNNSTVLQNDDHLAFSVAASEVWAFRMFGWVTIASGDPGFKHAFTVPAASSGYRVMMIPNTTAGSVLQASVGDLTTALAGAPTGLTTLFVVIEGVYVGGANAGTVQFQWAQQVAVASNTTLKLGSYLDLKRVA